MRTTKTTFFTVRCQPAALRPHRTRILDASRKRAHRLDFVGTQRMMVRGRSHANESITKLIRDGRAIFKESSPLFRETHHSIVDYQISALRFSLNG